MEQAISSFGSQALEDQARRERKALSRHPRGPPCLGTAPCQLSRVIQSPFPPGRESSPWASAIEPGECDGIRRTAEILPRG